MSVLGDAVQTLNEDVEVISFLPAVNYVFLHVASSDGSDLLFGLSFTAVIVGAALFNHLQFLELDESATKGTEGPEQWDDPRNDHIDQRQSNLQRTHGGTSAILLVTWIVLLLVSMYFLLQRFSENRVLPEVLFFVSVGFIALYATDRILKEYVYS